MSYAGGSRPQVLLDGLTDEQLRQEYARRDASNDFEAMPTVNGAPIVESGSNSDGTWFRFADGYQVCTRWSNFGGFMGAWTYPLPFTSLLSVAGNVIANGQDSSNVFLLDLYNAGNTSVGVRKLYQIKAAPDSAWGNASGENALVTAHGRWK